MTGQPEIASKPTSGPALRRVLICGSRYWNCPGLARRILVAIRARGGPFVLVHGDARGVDAAFRDAARALGIPDEPHPADWETYGRSAGPIRNKTMVDRGATFVVAVSKDLSKSRGTANCIGLALAAGIPVYHVDGQGVTRRVKG